MTFVMTDDELVAAAVLRGTVWFGMLPTVDNTVSDLVAASARGLRSLTVRRMLVGGDSVALTAELEATLAPTLGVRPEALAYVAAATDPSVAVGEVFARFPSTGPTSATAVVTLANGISEIEAVDLVTAGRILSAPIRSAFTTGVTPAADGSARLLVYIPDPTAPEDVLVISPGSVTRGTISAADGAFVAGETVDHLPTGL
jgi:hypothetical protein